MKIISSYEPIKIKYSNEVWTIKLCKFKDIKVLTGSFLTLANIFKCFYASDRAGYTDLPDFGLMNALKNWLNE